MDLKSRLKEYEGTLAYQQHIGTYRNGKFRVYKDSLQKNTIGYGHLVLPGENFSDGITEQEALTLLDNDIAIARSQLVKLNLVKLPSDWNDLLVIMLFQLGLTGTMRFKKMIAALQVHNYKEATNQMRDSLWYRQTPNRVNQMISVLINK